MPLLPLSGSPDGITSDWLRAGFLEPSPRKLLSLVSRKLTRRRESATPKLPLILGVVFGAFALILICSICWVYYKQRKIKSHTSISPDVISRPFPLEAKSYPVDTKLGHSRIQPAVSTFPLRPAPVEIASPHRRRRRQPAAPPVPPPSASRLRLERQIERELQRAQRREKIREKAEIRERERDQAERRTSTSKSVLGLLWHLPPVSEGYGVGLMTRENLDFRRLPSYHAGDTRVTESMNE
ncbi:hypothetical protein MIND_00976100 [Mycena indigotica]|uniref:Uncharacterized protein n=1 Tax=Mycena indigotica TaxID=2126181 RepID=A0A8H6SDA7_9AGAR|nr:uncharacterized protein MIND_00976100 [Mycena indigotica]KAF7297425.1 hypothetical protein MIND_00976100 [Mycena indigotica]